LIRVAVLTHETGTVAYNYNGDCSYANGFHILAEGLDVTPKASATIGSIFFLGYGKNCGWSPAVGLNP